MRRPALLTSTTAVAVLAVAAYALVVSSPTGQAATATSSAIGLTATGQVPVPATPHIESSDGKQHSSSALELPKNPLLDVRAATVTAGNDSAAVEILDLTVGKNALDQIQVPPDLKKSCDNLPATGVDDLPIPDLQLPNTGLPLPPSLGTKDLPVKNLPDLCKLLLTPPSSVLGLDAVNVWCHGDSGGVDIGSATLLGQKLDLPSTNTAVTIPAAPLGSISINKQTQHADGSFSVTALEINLAGAEMISLGQVTCAKHVAKATPKPTPSPQQPVEGVPLAPVPTPVKTRHPVTG